FARGSGFEDIKVLGQKIRVGICYEATHSKLYEDYPNVVLAISNNAWFYPSIEPVMQRMLMKYYARKNNSFVLHAANMSKSFVLAPF
ncbi:MAG: apolipoprotein N-acyltransferase, partial [Helicobacter sp.]|nr:apolipoprotein N-acyltransferase [Helicobacter sp.]